ncbi:hypothetical protein EON67_09180 [archaeon]|nr:MAG: hypothetical protein EON67_09180 [archaeon]
MDVSVTSALEYGLPGLFCLCAAVVIIPQIVVEAGGTMITGVLVDSGSHVLSLLSPFIWGLIMLTIAAAAALSYGAAVYDGSPLLALENATKANLKQRVA